MPIYRVKGPDGKYHGFEGPEGMTQGMAESLAQFYFEPVAEAAPAPQPKGESGFIPSIKRGYGQAESLLMDVAPALVAKAFGADEYAAKQMEEAAKTQKELQERYPTEVASYKDIKSVGDALTYIKEAIGEAIPSMLPSLFTGGAASLLARPATAAAMQAAEKVAAAQIARATAEKALTAEAVEAIKQQALKAGIESARRTALKYQAAGALTGSAAQNIPDVYQNVYEAGGTERADILPALVGGTFNAVLDAITPLNILRKAKLAGIPETQIIGAWYKRAGKGAVEGMLTEGGTEAVQEMSSAAAERFVNENKAFFTPENFTRFIDAGLKGGFGGAGITAATNVAFGRAEKEKAKERPEAGLTAEELVAAPEVAPRAAKTLTPEQAFEIERETAPEGTPDVGETIPEGRGAGVAVPEPASAVAPVAEGAEPSPAAGVVPAGEDVGVPTAGEAAAPVAVSGTQTPTPIIQNASSMQAAPEYFPEIIVPARKAVQEGNFRPVTLKNGTQVNLVVSQDEENQGGRVIALDQQGQEVGQLMFAKVTDENGNGYNPQAFVNEELRRQGLATAMYDLAEESGAKIPTVDQYGQIRSDEGQAFREARQRAKQPPTAAPTEVLDEEKITRPTPEAIKTGAKFDEALVGSLYDEERTLGSDTTDAKGNRTPLPEWSKLTRDQKDLYLGYITNNTGEEHDAARDALTKYRAELREASREDAQPEIDLLSELDPKSFTSPAEYQAAEAERKAKLERVYRRISDIKADPAAAAYTFNRRDQGRMERWAFPNWSDLTTEQRGIFTDELARLVGKQLDKNGNPVTDLNRATGDDLDQAFRKLGESMVAEATAQAEAERTTAETEQKRRQAEIEKETERKKAEEEKRKRNEYKARVGKARFIPDHVIQQIMKGNMGALMQYLRTAATQKIHQALAQRLYELKLQTKIKLVDSLPEGRLAQYDPKTDTIEVTAEGLKDEPLMHELAHAATVNILHKYFDLYLKGKPSGLSQDQLDAVEHLQELMDYSRVYLENTYPGAYENIYEFLGYGLSNIRFQDALNAIPMRKFDTTILPETKSGFSEFVASIIKMFKWGKELFTESGKVKKTAGLIEFLAAAEQIMEAPPGGIKMAPLPITKQAEPLTEQEKSLDQQLQDEIKRLSIKEHGGKRFLQNLFSKRGAQWLATTFQNERYPLKVAEDRAARFGILSRIGEKMNNVYGQISRSAGIAVDLFNTRVKNPTDEVHRAVEDYAQLLGIEVKDALPRLHLILEAMHEPERRMIKYLKKVPLDDMTKFRVKGFNDANGNPMSMSAEGWRKYIFEQLAKPEKVDAKALRRLLNQIVADPQSRNKLKDAALYDVNNPAYNVIAQRSTQELDNYLNALVPGVDLDTRTLPDTEVGRAVQQVVDSLKKVKDATMELNKEANYYSQPVDNVINFYDFKNYVPFKGRPEHELINDEFNIESRYVGGELQDSQDAFEGRLTESENPLLQILADGATAAMRAGRKDLMKSIENAVKDKIIAGDIEKESISFEDRFIHNVKKKDIGGPNKIFVYQPDGSIKIIEIRDKNQREALRRSYRTTHPLIDYANMATSTLGQMHTRYNPSFAPMNFVRDALTNAFTLGAELGPEKAGKLLTAVASDVASGGMKKSLIFSNLYANGKFDEIDALAKKDQYYQDLKDYVAMGGKVSYLQGVAARGALDELIKEVGRSGILKKKDQFDKFVDIYNDMFELSSRTATYRLMRDEFLAENKANGMSDADALADAQSHAVEYAKNLANFEQVGRYGKQMGAWFMFFRPAATGAVRAIESLAPAFGFDEAAFREEAKAQGRTEEQIDRAVEKMRKETKNARYMAAATVGLGVTVYMMAMLLAGDDDAGRNKVATDDMARWTRYARFHFQLFGKDIIFQLPWGFGMGAFASAGAQIAALLSNKQSFSEAASNILDAGMDSFLPLPISRISVVDNPAAKIMDTATPSLFRPFFEYVMNLDGLGREIYNNRQTRYGDAFTGGDNIPEIYKIAARKLFNATDGAVDWSPNTMYFFVNNYADAIGKVAAATTDGLMLAAGEKAMDEGALKSVPGIGSFIGSKSNYDAREFSKYEDRIKAMDKRLGALKSTPEKYSAYIQSHPEDYALTAVYNKQVNGALRRLRAAANQIRANPDLSPKERKEQLKDIVDSQNMVKRNLIEVFKQVEASH